MVVVYIDDLNVIGISELCSFTQKLLTRNFDMKLLDKTSLCLGLQVSHLSDGSIILHQILYVQKN